MKTIKYLAIGMLGLLGCVANKPTQRITFQAEDAYPEGIAYDSTQNVYYVSSARLGNIGKVSPEGVYTVLHADTTLKSTYGLKIHPDGKRLFACVGDANYSKFTSPETRKKMIRLISIDLATGKRLTDTDLSGLLPGKHFGNDLIFDSQGNAYVTDSYAHAIYKVPAQGNPSVFSKHKLFETEGIGLNGIVFHQAGFLLASNSNTGMLYKIDLNNPNNVSIVKTDQFFLGADGLLLQDNKLVVVVNGGNDKIYQLESEDNWQSAKLAATTLVADRFTYPATATKKGSETWIMNAKFNVLLDSNNVADRNFDIQQAVFKPVPKPK